MTAKRPVRGHIEASTIIFTQFVLDGVSWNLTMREGATAEQTLGLLAECEKVQAALTEAGAIFVLNRDATETLQRRQARRAEKPPTNGNGNGHVKAAAVKTGAWLQAGKDLADQHPCYTSPNGRPNYRLLTETAFECSFNEITDDNLAEVVAALEGVAAAQPAVTA